METVPFSSPFSAVIGNNLAKGPFHEFHNVIVLYAEGEKDLSEARIVVEDFGNIHFLMDLLNNELWYN